MRYKNLIALLAITTILNGCSMDELRPDINIAGELRVLPPSDLEDKPDGESNEGEDPNKPETPQTPSGVTPFVDGNKYYPYIVKQCDNLFSSIQKNLVDDSALDDLYYGIYFTGMTDAGNGRLEPAKTVRRLHKTNSSTVEGIAFAQTILNLSKQSVSSSYDLSAQGKHYMDIIDNLCDKSKNPNNEITLSDTYQSLLTKLEHTKSNPPKETEELLYVMSKTPSKSLSTLRSSYESVYRGLTNDATIIRDLFPGLSVSIPETSSSSKTYKLFEGGKFSKEGYTYSGLTPASTVSSFFSSDISPKLCYTGVSRDSNSLMKIAIDANYKLIVYLGCSGGTTLDKLLRNPDAVIAEMSSIASPNQTSGFNKEEIIDPSGR